MTKLKEIRLSKGLTQAALAEKSGISKRTIEKLEQNRLDINHAKAIQVYRLIRALGCGLGDILEIDAEGNPVAPLSDSGEPMKSPINYWNRNAENREG